MSLHQFVTGYITCALWTSTDENDVNLDGSYSAADLDRDSRIRIHAECVAFYDAHHATWADDELAGHDFWLTRNGHGTGFWDRSKVYGAGPAETLTLAAHAAGERSLIVTDDGEIQHV